MSDNLDKRRLNSFSSSQAQWGYHKTLNLGDELSQFSKMKGECDSIRTSLHGCFREI
jgi:hypothetical protein